MTERILVVDDEREIVQLCLMALSQAGYQAQGVGSGQEALNLMSVARFDLLLADLYLPDMDGLTLLRRARELDPQVAAVIITGYGTMQNAIEALEAGARGFLLKPFGAEDLVRTVQKTIAELRKEQENLFLRTTWPILEICQTLTMRGDVNSLAMRLLEIVLAQVSADRASLMLVDEQTNELYIAGALGLPAEVVRTFRAPVGQGISGQVILRKDPLVLNAADDLDPSWRAVMGQPEITSAVSLPLLAHEPVAATDADHAPPLSLPTRQRAIGVLNLSRLAGQAAFTPGELNQLSILGNQIALALENILLHREIQRHARELGALERAGRAVVSTLDLDTVLEVVIKEAQNLVAAESASVLLHDPVKDELIFAATAGPGSKALRGMRVSAATGLAGWVLRARQPTLVRDAQSDPRFCNHFDTLTGLTTRSLLAIPLIHKESVIGVIEAVSQVEGVFSEGDRALLEALAAVAATALANSQLFEVVARGKREWEATFDAIGDGISIHDADFRIVRANRALTERLGVPLQALIGRPCCELFHRSDTPMESCPHFRTLQSGQPQTTEVELPGLKGIFLVSTYPVLDEQGGVKASVHVLKDITEQKQTQAHLIQTEKMAALGRLAASLAHEINNPLQALRSGLRLLVGRPLDEEKRQRYLEVASREVERLIAIVERMLNFYRPSAEQRERTDINALLEEILALAGKQLQHSRVTVRRQLAPRLPPVETVAGQIKQVFLNIILNALDAMPGGGELTVATGWDRDQQVVWIAFTDNGVGIPAEDLPHIFEPFFTRKLKGTGLGLTISYGIVERHGGRITVESQAGKGSTFTVFLPA